MFLLEKKNNKAILTVYGYVGGSYLDYRNVINAIAEISKEGYSQLDFHLHTYGGMVFDGNLIYNAIAGFKGEVDIYVDGVAASMGSIIMMAGTRIHIAENGFIMIHAPSGGAQGNAKDLEATAKLLRSIEKNFLKKLMERTGLTAKDVAKWMDGTDYWFDADEAVELGLVNDTYAIKTTDSIQIGKEEVQNLGAKGAFEKFAALADPITQPKKTQMDKKALIARYGLKSVTDASTDDEVMAAIDAKIQAEQEKAKTATDELAKTQKASIEASVDNAISSGKIKKEKREEYITRGEKIGLGELNAIFADMQVYETITDKLEGKKGGEGKEADAERAKWSWDKWQEESAKSAEVAKAFEEMPKSDSKTFKALYKAKFGAEPTE